MIRVGEIIAAKWWQGPFNPSGRYIASSLGIPSTWYPGQTFSAAASTYRAVCDCCNYNEKNPLAPEKDTRIPCRDLDRNIGCGIHGSKRIETPGFLISRPTLGLVALFGTVIEAQKGYRAEFGRVFALRNRHLAEMYGVPCLTRSEMQHILEEENKKWISESHNASSK